MTHGRQGILVVGEIQVNAIGATIKIRVFASAAPPVPPERPTCFARGTGSSNEVTIGDARRRSLGNSGTDSPVEEDGFEPSVPPLVAWLFRLVKSREVGADAGGVDAKIAAPMARRG